MIAIELDDEPHWKLPECFRRTRPDCRSHRDEILLGELSRIPVPGDVAVDGQFLVVGFEQVGRLAVESQDVTDQAMKARAE